MGNNFRVIILNGRPASGKSEVIDYFKKASLEERSRRLHVGNFMEIDDFPYIWAWFEEDMILAKYGKPRLHTDDKLYFKEHFAWDLCIERLNLDYQKKLATSPNFLDNTTLFIEFSRGGEHAYEEAYSYLSDEILKEACIVYINVSYEESVRKNRKRARKGQEGSILHHSLPDEKMEFYYKADDFRTIAPPNDGYLDIKGHKVPYSYFNNEPDVTDNFEELGKALEGTFGRLHQRLDAK